MLWFAELSAAVRVCGCECPCELRPAGAAAAAHASWRAAPHTRRAARSEARRPEATGRVKVRDRVPSAGALNARKRALWPLT